MLHNGFGSQASLKAATSSSGNVDVDDLVVLLEILQSVAICGLCEIIKRFISDYLTESIGT